MEPREILIANSKDQRRYKITTAAVTLLQLKEDIMANNNVQMYDGVNWIPNTEPINTSGMTFTEGITKTQLIADDSVLPTNVMFRGTPTNSLVILLTNTTKNIASGAGDRKTAYELIKQMGLQNTIKEIYGKNFTQVSTDNLYTVIEDSKNHPYECSQDSQCTEVSTPETPSPSKPSVSAAHPETVNWLYDGIKAMVKNNTLYVNDVVVLSELISEYSARLQEETPQITDEDITLMLHSL